MSWQLASVVVLGLALVGGFGWYERSRPDARIVALVGTLAAFAALGRIAFAALPNVKPTTDIVLISGFALGGAPGFAVGALAALVSNFFFGQGPWTPWQMVGWGMTGILGAGLAVLTRRRLGRWPLAAACFAVGFGFTALQDVGDWVNYSDHSSGQLAVYVGKGLGFDVVHATGCLLFALAFGPALVRSLRRFRQRLQVQWGPAIPSAAPLLLAVVLLGAGGLAVAARPAAASTAARSASAYLLGAQNDDGGFGASPGAASSPLYTGWAALALAADGRNPQDVIRGGHSVIDYLRSQASGVRDAGDLERTILAVRSAGLTVTDFGGHDLLGALERDVRRDGSVAQLTNQTAFAVLAFRAAGVTPRAATLRWLARQQDSDGGFNFAAAGGASDVDDTAAVLEALAGTSVGASSAGGGGRATGGTVISRALGFLRGQQNRDGGFPSQTGAGSNAQSTAFAIQGLIAAGVSPGGVHRRASRSPLGYLAALSRPDGHVRYSAGTDQTPVWVTAQALIAMAGAALPVAAPARASTSSTGSRGGTHASSHGHSRRATGTPARTSRDAARHRNSRGGSRGAAPAHRRASTAASASVANCRLVARGTTGVVQRLIDAIDLSARTSGTR